MRKSIVFSCILLLAALSAQAQQYISNSYLESEGRLANLNGDCGILLLSAESDLVIEVINASKDVQINTKGKSVDGRYEYEIVVSKDDTRQPKIKVSRRGKTAFTQIVKTVKPNYFIAFNIEEVKMPIRAVQQTQDNDAILNDAKGELEISTALKGIKVDFPAGYGVKPVTKAKKGNDSVSITTIQFPLAPLNEAKAKAEAVTAAYEALSERLTEGNSKGTDEEWNRLDQLEKEANDSITALSQLQSVNVYGPGSNVLTIDLSGWTPRKKQVWAILPDVIIVHTTECGAKMDEADRLFTQREYKAAAGVYKSALQAKGIDDNLRSTINEMIVKSDSCDYHQTQMFKAVNHYSALKKQGTAIQKDVAACINIAINHAEWLNKNNEQGYYYSKIKQMKEVLEDLPLTITFTVTALKYRGVSGIREEEVKDKATLSGTMKNGKVVIYGNTDKKGQFCLRIKKSDMPKTIQIDAGERNNPYVLDLEEFLRDKEWEYNELQKKVVLRKK